VYGQNLLVDTCVTILGKCPAEYTISGTLAEFHFGSVLDGFHFAFDATALHKLMSLATEAVAQLEQPAPVAVD
jgi:hypothetical protein